MLNMLVLGESVDWDVIQAGKCPMTQHVLQDAIFEVTDREKRRPWVVIDLGRRWSGHRGNLLLKTSARSRYSSRMIFNSDDATISVALDSLAHVTAGTTRQSLHQVGK